MKDKREKQQWKPEDHTSKYIRERVSIRDRMHTDYWERDNGNFMKHQDMEVLGKMWDDLGHFRGTIYKTRFEK